MKPIRISLIAAGLTMALGSTAFAQSGPMPGSMPGPMAGAGMQQAQPMHEHMHEPMCEHMGERHARHLAELKTRLKLGADQEAAWKTFTDAMQPPAAPPARADRAAMDKLTTPERIDQMQALHAQRDAEMKKRGDATKTFYASLNAEQKKTFDAETARHMRQGQRMRPHGDH